MTIDQFVAQTYILYYESFKPVSKPEAVPKPTKKRDIYK